MNATHYAATDKTIPAVEPGDFILTRSRGYVGSAIRFGERMRFRGPHYEEWNTYNHAAGVVDNAGNIIEMLGRGATSSNIEKYQPKEFWHVKCPDPSKAMAAVNYWQWCLEIHVGYSWLAVVSDGLSCLTGSRVEFGTDGRLICSGLVAAGYCYAGMPGVMEWVADPSHVFPCELGHRYAS